MSNDPTALPGIAVFLPSNLLAPNCNPGGDPETPVAAERGPLETCDRLELKTRDFNNPEMPVAAERGSLEMRDRLGLETRDLNNL